MYGMLSTERHSWLQLLHLLAIVMDVAVVGVKRTLYLVNGEVHVINIVNIGVNYFCRIAKLYFFSGSFQGTLQIRLLILKPDH